MLSATLEGETALLCAYTTLSYVPALLCAYTTLSYVHAGTALRIQHPTVHAGTALRIQHPHERERHLCAYSTLMSGRGTSAQTALPACKGPARRCADSSPGMLRGETSRCADSSPSMLEEPVPMRRQLSRHARGPARHATLVDIPSGHPSMPTSGAL